MWIGRIGPTALVVAIGTLLLLCGLCIVLPKLAPLSSAFLVLAHFVSIIVAYALWLWSWLAAALGDPGSVSEDLRRRGLLARVADGDLPRCIRHLPVCAQCRLPRPYQCLHCDTCGACRLRFDHHCALMGQCVADRNFKAFVLSFFWGGALCAATAASAALLAWKGGDGWPGFIAAYSLVIGACVAAFGCTAFAEGRAATAVFSQMTGGPAAPLDTAAFLESFGDVWWKKVLPIQRGSTFLAWPGVSWELETIPL
jgi:hypothetical protein